VAAVKSAVDSLFQFHYSSSMAVALDLGKMTTADKLRLMEDLWQNSAAEDLEIPSPSWHGDVLTERERLVTSGEESYIA
jgi:hypothetical protein